MAGKIFRKTPFRERSELSMCLERAGLKGVLTRSSSRAARPSRKHLRSVPRLLGGPYTTICSCMKIARYGENCSMPLPRSPSSPQPGIYEFATCAPRRKRGSKAAEANPLKISMINTIQKKSSKQREKGKERGGGREKEREERHAFLTRYLLRSI